MAFTDWLKVLCVTETSFAFVSAFRCEQGAPDPGDAAHHIPDSVRVVHHAPASGLLMLSPPLLAFHNACSSFPLALPVPTLASRTKCLPGPLHILSPTAIRAHPFPTEHILFMGRTHHLFDSTLFHRLFSAPVLGAIEMVSLSTGVLLAPHPQCSSQHPHRMNR